MKRSGIGPRYFFIAAAFVFAAAPDVPAQVLIRRDKPRAGSWEAAGGVTWTGGFSGGERSAELTRNGQTSGGFDLFTSDSRMSGGAGVEGMLAFYVSRTVAIEAGVRYSKPRLTIRLTGDVEEAEPVSAEETLTRYLFTGSVVMHLRRPSAARRVVPFVAAGAGYVRELHQGNQLIETGTEFHAMGGLKYWLGAAPRRFGVRAEAGVSIRDGGFDFEDKSRLLPIAAASFVYLF